MEPLWQRGRLPRVEDWFERLRARPTFGPAFTAWLPHELAAEMRANGERSWPQVRGLLGI
jgi:glutathione S-transferase